jgi:ElaB/YqjD/DUF883 family membrane-anchored ribosome-binding protein
LAYEGSVRGPTSVAAHRFDIEFVAASCRSLSSQQQGTSMAIETDDVKTPSQIAEEARQAGRDAVQAVQGHVHEANQIGRDAVQAIRPNVEDARQTAREAVDTAKGVASDAQDIASDAARTGRAYARDAANKAVDKASSKFNDFRQQVGQARDNCAQYIADEPVKAALISAAGGAALTVLLLSMLRAGRSYYD